MTPVGSAANPRPRRCVFFDFAGTLFSDRDLRDAHLAQLRFVADTLGVAASDGELRVAYRHGLGVAFQSVAGRASYSHRELFGSAFAVMAEAIGGSLDATQVNAAVDRQYQATIEHAKLRPGCRETLELLRAAGVYLQIVSNIDHELLEGLVERLGLSGLLDAWTSSEEAASCKPDPGIFQLALTKAGCDAGQVLFVGDTVAHDIAGPAAMGMRTALLVADRPPDVRVTATPDYVIERLDEVPALVELGASR
jgi:putative hydrolase of the HAD superfamily